MATEKMTTEKKLGEVILSVKDLKVNFRAYGGLVQAVRGISFDPIGARPWPSWVNPAPANR